jgi:hypothetical protein
MSQRTPANCPHDLRPGITVCLRCKSEERKAARAKAQQNLSRLGAIAVGVTVIGALGAAAFTMARNQKAARPAATVTRDSTPAATTPASVPTPDSAATAAAPPAQAPTQAATEGTPPLTPMIGVDSTTLAEGVHAARSGNDVVVRFDTPMVRTRRAEKFERIVRETLPKVYGSSADSLLARIPAGAIVRSGDLINELPARGVRLAAGGGWTLTLWPETRQGRDGPLVVSYRAALARN